LRSADGRASRPTFNPIVLDSICVICVICGFRSAPSAAPWRYNGSARMTRQYRHIGARTIAYLDSAPGDASRRTLVLLHAFPLGAGMWERQISAIPSAWRLITPDLRGFGGSTDPETSGSPSMDDYAADVIDLLAELGTTRAVIGGVSMGGYATFAVLRLAPERIEGVVLANTRAGADTPQGRENRRAMLALVDREGPAGVAREMVAKLLGRTTRETNPAAESTVRRLVKQHSNGAIRGAIVRMMNRPDSTPLLPGLRVPTLIIAGDEDELTPADEARRMADAVPGSTLVVIPSAGHLSNLEQPDAFNRALTGFLNAL
jgi:pimeloyl-ACP methyl ester carboxylesterase